MKSIDILIGLTVIMLVASMAVTVLTQVWTTLFNHRGRHLRQGLQDLLNQLHCALSPNDTKAIVQHILMHPLIRNSPFRLGDLIHRDELTRLLLEAAADKGPYRLSRLAHQALVNALTENGIADAEATLKKIRDTATALETSCPALAGSARQDLAILQAASSDFVAKINGWFDQTIDRVSARFTFTTRQITIVNALLVAVTLQLDVVALVNRLAADDALRSTLVQQAYATQKLTAFDPHQLTLLAAHDIFPIGTGLQDWAAQWHPAKLPGVVLAVLLMSLGAPFWFETLKSILRFRSVIAQRDDAQRAVRNS